MTKVDDYEQALEALERMGQDLSASLADFMDQVNKYGNQASIIKEWEKK